MGDQQIEISIPSDEDGYVLFKCPLCGTYFKITPTDYQDEGVLNIYCPSCGICSENYITDDVLELSMSMAQNVAMDLIYSEIKKWEKQLNKGVFSFNAGKKPRPEPENPIKSGVEALTITQFRCCNRSGKIKPMLRITGCYCPFCGVKEYEIE